MAPKIGCEPCHETAPPTVMNLGLLFRPNFRCKDLLVQLPFMNIQVFLSIELFPTILNITEELPVRHHVGFDIEQSVSCVITTLMLTSLYLILDALTSTEVASFMVNVKIFITFWTLEFFVNSSVAVIAPASSKSLAAFVTFILLVVKVGLLHVPGKFLLPVGELGAQVTCENLPLLHVLHFNRVNNTIHHLLICH